MMTFYRCHRCKVMYAFTPEELRDLRLGRDIGPSCRSRECRPGPGLTLDRVILD